LPAGTLGARKLFQLLNHFLVILDHHLRKFFYFIALCVLLGKLAQLNFGFVVS
jgi:hypothetical protein